jgi:NADPH-dependent sulfite reductase flavoprotein alpha-component
MTQPVKSVCPYCGVGCGLILHVESGRITKVSGDKSHPASFGRLCTKGLTSAQAITAPGRMASAYLRRDRQSEQMPVAIDAAIAEAASRLRTILDKHGPDSIALYVSGQMSLEAQYLANKLAKGFWGTNNIDSNSRLCMSSAASGYKLSLGADGPPGSYEDFDKADLFFAAGANMADCHPILFLRMMDRIKSGAKLIVADPRRTATAEKADLHLQLKPGTDLALLNALLHELIRNGAIDKNFIDEFTEGWEDMPAFLKDYTPACAAAITGLPEADIIRAASWIAEAGNWMSCWTMGLNQSTHGTWHSNAICNLHLATGAICRPGSGPFSLTGQPNAMGGRETGYLAQGLPGQREVTSAEDRNFVESLWRIPAGSIRAEPGPDAVTMFNRLAAGEIKAVWIICTNPVASLPNRQTVINGLQAAELVITQDAFLDTETNFYADILLPGALWAEAEGVMVNSERNLTLMTQAVEPPGDASADWQIIADIARAMGFSEAFTYANAAEVFDEIRAAWNPRTGYDIRGISHATLQSAPAQWPCPPGDAAARHPLRYLNDGLSQTLLLQPNGATPRLAFPTPSGKARFFPRPYLPPAELPDQKFPFILNTGRLPHQWHSMTKTGKIPTLTKLNPGPFVELHPEDAAALGIADKDMVELRSRRGRACLPATITTRVQPGACFTPFHWNDVFGEDLAINAVTNDATDPISGQPEFKFCAIALTRAAIQPRTQAPAQSAAPEAADTSAITILFASQTGNAEALAEKLAATLRAGGAKPRLASMQDYPAAALAGAENLILISSTYGDGEAPDNGRDFWDFLNSQAPPLPNLSYAVCALGDSSYDQFCQHGKNLEAKFFALGATRLAERFDCDTGYEAAVELWLPAIAQTLGADPAEPPPAGPETHGKTNPFPAKLLASTRLNGEGADKDTRFISISLEDAPLTYEAGDALGVWPQNCPDLVDEFLALTQLHGDTPVTLPKTGNLGLRQALQNHLELTRPNREFLELLAETPQGADLRPLLEDSAKSALKTYLWGKQLPDILAAHPARLTGQEIIGALKPLQPRNYSIASSPRAHPGEVHLTIAALRYGTPQRKGACSTYLADRAADQKIPVFIQPSPNFRLPANPATPIIMIGPGTGIAPFRAFLHERRATGATGRNWLFFGERHQATDFYYRDELAAMQKDGFLTELSLAFSRDQPEKRYVQHCLHERGAEIWAWLQDGAAIYVCGDAAQMAKDVEAALVSIVEQHGHLLGDAARDYLRRLAREKRYLRDVY